MSTPWIRDIAGRPREWAFTLAAAALVGGLLALLGPFGTFLSASLGLRLAYWIGLLTFSVAIYLPSLRIGSGLCGRADLPRWFGLACAILIASGPMAVFAQFVAGRLWARYIAALTPLDWYGQTLIIATPLCAAYAAKTGLLQPPPGARDPAADVSTPSLPALAPGSPFLARLPPRLGRELLCLQMEDHYVRAHTAIGSDLILIPLHQAVAELEGMDGLQVHRSWWVSRRAVAEVLRDGRSWRLRLRNGVAAPVSRRAVATLKAAGWAD